MLLDVTQDGRGSTAGASVPGFARGGGEGGLCFISCIIIISAHPMTKWPMFVLLGYSTRIRLPGHVGLKHTVRGAFSSLHCCGIGWVWCQIFVN